MSDWDSLRARYSSKGQYLNRKVLFNRTDFEDFSNWLVDQGAEVSSEPKQDEALRFKLNGELGIVYSKGSGNLLAHDLGYKYDQDRGYDVTRHNAMNMNWNLSAKKQMPGETKNKGMVFEYCYSCKDIQELRGDQCAVCSSYIRF
ncbi:hypothetical protein HCY66_06950 [Acinetobacter radioresistens]|jgi:hypothetical protein|uniref:hypothetical protein n=1 Tax=Acinetobacter radioresistens TaxID=40216 RepID=UPI002003BCF8|nr:hypothetical protein [Acinetobacter radioresistens]MCK4089821.1 hypothetical protein [Acinetobacter radioresistens]